jgi:DNA-binding transcriptional ArsR family regulator
MIANIYGRASVSPKLEAALGKAMMAEARKATEGVKFKESRFPINPPPSAGQTPSDQRRAAAKNAHRKKLADTRAARRKALLTHAALTPRTRQEYLAALDIPPATMDDHLGWLRRGGYVQRRSILQINCHGTQRVKVSLWKVTPKGRAAIENTPEEFWL